MTPYTDSQMVIASQIAYLDFDVSMLAGGPRTVREILETQAEYSTGYEQRYAQYLLRRIDTEPKAAVCGDWKIIDVRNDQEGSGMYACLLDTGEENALLAFRGSESDTAENVIKDWGASDLGLLNSLQTPQQRAAEIYTEDIYREYGSQYRNFGITGHSLGGNLAEHAAVTAPEAMREQITQCVNLDGPGFSEAYMVSHAEEIRRSAPAITHAQWSLVGTLLFPLPGTDYRIVSAGTPEKGSGLNSLLWRHETTMVQYDGNGNFRAGERDVLAKAAGPFTRMADRARLLLVPGTIAVSGTLGLRQTLGVQKRQNPGLMNRGSSGEGMADGSGVGFGTGSAEYEWQGGNGSEFFAEIEARGREMKAYAGRSRTEAESISCFTGNGLRIRGKMAAMAAALEADAAEVVQYAESGSSAVEAIQEADRQAATVLGGMD
ncbi:MAG: DUF2974 domain-containing protein [Eubacteriales bacterium]|nr:DUF2974 domain-containing protein [Eubacteriales bacterium]